jgi:hypothetical protein
MECSVEKDENIYIMEGMDLHQQTIVSNLKIIFVCFLSPIAIAGKGI